MKKWNNELVVKFLNYSGLEEYSESFRENQIVGENLLKMDDNDLGELGVKAKGDVIKFRKSIQKLLKIDENQKRNRKINKKLNALRTHACERSPPNRIRWESNLPMQDDDESEEDDDQSGEKSSSVDGSNISLKNTRRTKSGVSEEKKKTDSIDVKRKPRRSSDVIMEKIAIPEEPIKSLDSDSRKIDLVNRSKFTALCEKKKPKYKRAVSLLGNEVEFMTAFKNFREDSDMGAGVLNNNSNYESK